ncbi:MAG TPA: glycosyltransferase [Gammaproteobacteria bacterium]|nr:glycosyltransferase [Gammaproteobacteria bacterium]
MKKPFFGLYILYLMLLVYGITLSWFLYVGPYTTRNVDKLIQQQHQRIVISLTTTPHRIDKLKNTLDSLLAQSIQVDQLYLNIPYHFKRDNIPYVVPNWLEKYPGITINRVEDFGPITKLLSTLQYETDPNTIIITVDDDVWYPRHVVRDLVHYALQHPDVVVTPLNVNFSLNKNYDLQDIAYKFKHGSRGLLVVGAAGVAYRRGFFADDFADMLKKMPPICALADDLMLSLYLKANNITVAQTTRHSLNPLIVPFTYKKLAYGFAPDALSFAHHDFTANPQNYAKCLREMDHIGMQHLVKPLNVYSKQGDSW